MKKKCLFVISSLLLAVALFSWFILKQRVVERKKEPSRQPSLNNQQSQNEEVVDKSVVPKPSYVNDEESKSSDVSTWNEYQNTQYRFTFRYPLEGWVIPGGPAPLDTYVPYNVLNNPVFSDTLISSRIISMSGLSKNSYTIPVAVRVYKAPTDINIDSKILYTFDSIESAPAKTVDDLSATFFSEKPGGVIYYDKIDKGNVTIREIFWKNRNNPILLSGVAYITGNESQYMYELAFDLQNFGDENDYNKAPFSQDPSDGEYLDTWQNIINSFQVY